MPKVKITCENGDSMDTKITLGEQELGCVRSMSVNFSLGEPVTADMVVFIDGIEVLADARMFTVLAGKRYELVEAG